MTGLYILIIQFILEFNLVKKMYILFSPRESFIRPVNVSGPKLGPVPVPVRDFLGLDDMVPVVVDYWSSLSLGIGTVLGPIFGPSPSFDTNWRKCSAKFIFIDQLCDILFYFSILNVGNIFFLAFATVSELVPNSIPERIWLQT